MKKKLEMISLFGNAQWKIINNVFSFCYHVNFNPIHDRPNPFMKDYIVIFGSVIKTECIAIPKMHTHT